MLSRYRLILVLLILFYICAIWTSFQIDTIEEIHVEPREFNVQGFTYGDNINEKSSTSKWIDPNPDLVSFTEYHNLEWLFPRPEDVPEEHLWRYKSTNFYWSKNDTIYRKFEYYKSSLQLPPDSIVDEVDRICSILIDKNRDKACELFRNCYPDTLVTTTSILPDNTVYITTGDIGMMWLRDSAAQVQQYIPLLKKDPYIQIIVEGLIRRQIQWIKLDIYGSAFRTKLDWQEKGKTRLNDRDFNASRTIHVSQHDYEVDSLCNFLHLSYNYYVEMNECYLFESEWLDTAKRIVSLWILEQDHSGKSNYTYPNLAFNGRGNPVCNCNLTWGGHRPSDDPCIFNFSIPSNMFVVVVLRELQNILHSCYSNEFSFIKQVNDLEIQIDDAIAKYGVVELEEKGLIYAYEVDGCGNHIIMDDANIPSLLSIDYLGYTTKHDPQGEIAKRTQSTMLSESNVFYFSGEFLRGIGSPHTPKYFIWPMSLIMEVFADNSKVNLILDMITETDANTGFIHESIHCSSPITYTRPWFTWANSLFADMIVHFVDEISILPGRIE